MIKGLPRVAERGELVAIDTEFFGQEKAHRPGGVFACMTIAYENGDAYIVLEQEDIPDALERIEAGSWVMQNFLYDIRQLRRYVRIDQRPIHDCMLVEMDLFGGWYSRFSLKNLARRWLGIMLDKGVRDKFSKSNVLTEEMMHYAIDDAKVTVQIARKQLDYIEQEYNNQFSWYWDIDEPSGWAVLDMKPARVDVEAWNENARRLQEDAMQAQEELGYNVNSHKIVKKKIEAALGRGIKSTNANKVLIPLLGKLNKENPAAVLIREVIKIRKMRKAAETYGKTWTEQHVEDGYVYSSWRVTGTETGRMSSANPNLQNVPKREMPIFREFFLASSGHVLQVADVSQQEPWFSAFMSNDQVLLQELQKGTDLHQVTADLFGVERNPRGKAISLALNYGMSEYGLAIAADISEEKARAGILARDRRYRQLTGWKGQKKNEARRHYKVHTVTGRPCWVNPYGEQWGRNAINAPIQGSAADHTKMALVNIHKKCAELNMPFCVTMVVHDEIVMDVPIEHKDLYGAVLKQAWDDASAVLAPGMAIRADVMEGPNWSVKE